MLALAAMLELMQLLLQHDASDAICNLMLLLPLLALMPAIMQPDVNAADAAGANAAVPLQLNAADVVRPDPA